MDNFRDDFLSATMNLAHTMWRRHYGHLDHVDEPNWYEWIHDRLHGAVEDALAEPERQHNVYRGID